MGGKCPPKRREPRLYLVRNTIKTLKELRMKQISATRKRGMKREQ